MREIEILILVVEKSGTRSRDFVNAFNQAKQNIKTIGYED
jgi:hypothetical protein